jgi:hypothetical protein
VLEDIVGWERPPAALAAPAVAAAGEARAAAVPFEGAQALEQLQLAVLLLTACQRVLVFCGGGGADGGECGGECCQRTWEFLLAAEMLARGIPDPSLPPRDPQQQGAAAKAAGGASTAAAAASATGQQQGQAARQEAPPVQEHLAEVVLLHVLPAGTSGGPTALQLQRLEQRLDAFFSSSRLRRPGAGVAVLCGWSALLHAGLARMDGCTVLLLFMLLA